MHVPAGHRFPDATGVAFASAWARHRCLQLYFYMLFVQQQYALNTQQHSTVSPYALEEASSCICLQQQ